ncbi:MAG: leucine-rich repeat protein [Firmicutes bacterium]|nr:leucine-rich repeat protein [Bacillota bacterium]
MTNKRFFTKGKILAILLMLLFAIATAGVLGTQLVVQAHANVEYEAFDTHYMRATSENIATLNDVSNYELMRVHHEHIGVQTYIVPIYDNGTSEYAEYDDDFFNAFSANESADFRTVGHGGRNYNVRRIRYSGRLRADSIVIVLMGDGFTAAQIGAWPNPAANTFLYHAREAMNTMIATHPFSYFSSLFTVYAVQIVSRVGGVAQIARVAGQTDTQLIDAIPFGPNAPATSYFGSRFIGDTATAATSTIRMPVAARTLGRNIANAVAGGAANLNMIQVIANQDRHGGVAWAPTPIPTENQNFVGFSLTATQRVSAGNPWSAPTSEPTLRPWHGTFIHEFGHSFGDLSDEFDGITNLLNRRANISSVSNVDTVKWSHWIGHGRQNANHGNVTVRQLRDRDIGGNNINWFVPSAATRRADGRINAGDCIMIASWASRHFGAVSSAELTRRLAHLSGETFRQGRSPNTNNANPNPAPVATMTAESSHNRILPYAFHGNRVLHTLTIPANISTIGRYAFLGATGLRIIHNNSVMPQQINNTTFAGTGNHAVNRANITVHIPSGTYQSYRVAGWTGFNLVEAGTRGLIIVNNVVAGFNAQPGFDGHVLIPEGITAIGASAFAGNTLLSKITLPSTMVYIGTNAFSNSSLSSMVILNTTSVIILGNYAFSDANIHRIYLANDNMWARYIAPNSGWNMFCNWVFSSVTSELNLRQLLFSNWMHVTHMCSNTFEAPGNSAYLYNRYFMIIVTNSSLFSGYSVSTFNTGGAAGSMIYKQIGNNSWILLAISHYQEEGTITIHSAILNGTAYVQIWLLEC